MIERIYCKNFRSIGECDIRLRDGLTVLIGKNGTGKSSIIESITFNLYGKIKDKTNKETVRRKGSEDGDPTISIIDFSFNGVYYRCRRWYTPKMSTMGTLYSFTPAEYEDLSNRPILDFDKTFGTEVASSTSGVTAAVESLLGVSYDGFKASFVAQQKELNSFAGLAPEKRKEFFLNLLGYSALDSAKPELSSKVKSLKTTIESLENQNLNVDEIQKIILTQEKEIDKTSKSIEKGKKLLAEADAKFADAAGKYEEVRLIAEKVSTYKEDLDRLDAEKISIEHDIEGLSTRIAENKKKTAGFDPSSSIADQLHRAETKRNRHTELSKARSQREQIEIQVKDLERKIAQQETKLAELEKKTEKEPDLTSPRAKKQELKTKYELLKHTDAELQNSIDRLSGLIASVEAGEMAKCPTCGNSIANEEGKQHLSRELAEVQAEKETLAQEISRCVADGQVAAKNLELAEGAARTYDSDVKAKLTLSTTLAHNRTDHAEKSTKVAALVEEEAKNADAALSDKEVFLLNEEIAKLIKQKEEEEKMRAAATQLATDEQALKLKQERLSAIGVEYKEKNSYVKSNTKKAESADKKKQVRDEAQAKTIQYRDLLSVREQQRAAAESLLSAQQGNLKRALQQSEQLAEFKEQIEDAMSAQLVVEFLRKELPARIAPRLSDVAGHLLDIATNGRYSMIELDEQYNVRVYTDDDIRPISQMSGGEADVISLALRIAIAKILLEASGIPSQTFILDEIFGALDDERRESTCNALMNIQDELSKILCITHIDEIKDMADYTYVVERDENNVSWVREQKSGITALKEDNAVAAPEKEA